MLVRISLVVGLLSSAPAFAAEVPKAIAPSSRVQPDGNEVNAIVSNQLGQLQVQLAVAQATINAMQREIDRLTKDLADKSVPQKKGP